MAKRCGLLWQPAEVLDSIVCNVEDRPDLLSLGLTSKLLASFVFPQHVQYHTVSAPLHDVLIWQHLIQNRACARTVRRVEVIHDFDKHHGSWGPNHFQVHPEDQPSFNESTSACAMLQDVERDRWREKFLVLALRGMPHLRSFVWRRTCPPVISSGETVWQVLQHKEFLADIRLFEDSSTTQRYSGIELQKYGICSLLSYPVSNSLFGLTRFEFHVISTHLDCPRHMTSLLDSLIHWCRSLEIITIIVRTPERLTMNTLFKRGRWPNLRKLQLGGFDISVPRTTSLELESFLTFHIRLSHITLTTEGYGDFPCMSLPPNSLPNLTSVCVENTILKTIFACPCTPPRRIEETKNLCLTPEIFQQPAIFLQGIEKDALKSVTITEVCDPRALQRFALLFPCVECLDVSIDYDMATWDEDMGSMRVLLIAEWTDNIALFQNLRVLRGVPVLNEIYLENFEEQAEVIEHLATLFPMLEWFSVPHIHSRVNIVRGGDAVTWNIE